MDEEGDSLRALLYGLTSIDYFHDEDITESSIHQALYCNLQTPEYDILVHGVRGLIKSMAMTAMDMRQAESFLQSQTRKKDARIKEKDVDVFLNFWESHRQRVHTCLVEACHWNKTLANVNWRIDMKAKSKQREVVNTPTANIELSLVEKERSTPRLESLQFEMDDNALALMTNSLKNIKEHLQAYQTNQAKDAFLFK